jgi:tetratricopeptide (TPR) repeat protein
MRSGRNEFCPCGSGKKFKHCCGSAPGAAAKDTASAGEGIRMVKRPRLQVLLDGMDNEAARVSRSFLPPRRKLAAPADGAQARASNVAPAKAAREAAVRLQRGAQLIKSGEPEAAIAPLSEAVRLAPQNSLVHHDLGLARLETRRLPGAIASFQKAIALKPDFSRAHHSLAVALDRAGRIGDAIAAYKKAAELDPKNVQACTRLAELLNRFGMIDDATAWLYRAAAVDPRSPTGRLNRARALLNEQKLAEAERELRRLVVLAPRQPGGNYLLGTILSSSGRFAEAIASFEQAILTDPNDCTAYLSRVLVHKLTEADRPLVARLLALLERRSAPDEARMIAHFALGKAYDDLKDYAEAMHHFDAANALRKRFSTFDPEEHRKRVDGLIATCTPDFFARHREVASLDATPVLIVGLPRSGTTLVEQIISAHPQVAAAGELIYWAQQGVSMEPKLADGIAPDRARAITDGYLSLLRTVSAEALRVTDKMPLNLLLVGAIHALFPNARIFHCRRHPVDTCISIYSLYFATQMDFASSKENLAFYYRQCERLVDHWRQVLPADRFFEVEYEALTANPEPLARQMIAFCGLDWDEACLRPEDNERTVNTASVWQVRQPIYRSSTERWRRYEPWLGALRELLPAVENRGEAT